MDDPLEPQHLVSERGTQDIRAVWWDICSIYAPLSVSIENVNHHHRRFVGWEKNTGERIYGALAAMKPSNMFRDVRWSRQESPIRHPDRDTYEIEVLELIHNSHCGNMSCNGLLVLAGTWWPAPAPELPYGATRGGHGWGNAFQRCTLAHLVKIPPMMFVKTVFFLVVPNHVSGSGSATAVEGLVNHEFQGLRVLQLPRQ